MRPVPLLPMRDVAPAMTTALRLAPWAPLEKALSMSRYALGPMIFLFTTCGMSRRLGSFQTSKCLTP